MAFGVTPLKLDLKIGTEVVGKWHKRKYQIEGLLGEGANGKVYLASRGSRRSSKRTLYALKVSFDSVDHQSEINALQQLEKQRVFSSRYLMDVDDMIVSNESVPFYVMRYIQGGRLPAFLKAHGQDWLWVIGKHLLQSLANLHRHGWVFCDLKIENVIVHDHGATELIDFGGITRKGRSVKQFTELYDRGYWGLGSRQADEAYDLFSFAILFIQLADERNRWKDASIVLPQHRNLNELRERIDSHPLPRTMSPFLNKALEGKFSTSKEALYEWKRLMNESSESSSRQLGMEHSVRLTWISGLFLASLGLFGWTVVMLF